MCEVYNGFDAHRKIVVPTFVGFEQVGKLQDCNLPNFGVLMNGEGAIDRYVPRYSVFLRQICTFGRNSRIRCCEFAQSIRRCGH